MPRPSHAAAAAATALGLLVVAPAAGAAPGTAPGGVTATAAKGPVPVLAKPGGKRIARLAKGARAPIVCQTSGPLVAGPYGRSKIWDKVRVRGRVGFVSDSRVFTGSDSLVTGACGTRPAAGATKPGRIGTERLPPIVRSGPTTTAREVTRLPRGTRVRISCQAIGPAVQGTYGTSKLWNRITQPAVGFVPDSYTYTGSDGRVAPDCKPTGADPGGGDQSPNPGGGPRPGQAEEGRCTSDVPFALERAPGSRAEFVARFGPGASTSDRRTGVPAAVTLGQGLLESGDGQHTAGANNYFGIKAAHKGGDRYRWGDEAVGCVFRKTKEQRSDGSEYTVLAAFRLYRSATDSFVDHSEFLSESSRYRPAFAVKDDSRAFVRAIWKAGYATDTQYPQKVISLMDANDLYRFDVR